MATRIADLLGKYQKGLNQAIKKYREKEEVWKYTEASLTLFTIAFFVIFAIRPAVTTISGLVGEIKEKELISSKMRKKINAIIEAQEEYALYQQRVSLVDSFLPPNLNVAQGLAQVIGAAGETRLPAEGVSVSEFELNNQVAAKAVSGKSGTKKTVSEKSSQLGEVKFNFGSTGDYSDLREFISRLIKTRRWIEISQYQIGKSQDEDNTSQLKLTINGKLYFWSVGEE